MSKVYAVILAGGKGLRLGDEIPKQFLLLNDMPVIAWSMEKFDSIKEIDHIIIVSSESEMEKTGYIAKDYIKNKPVDIIKGGSTRQESSYNAVSYRKFKEEDIILLHDAARPFVSKELIISCINKVKHFNGSALYVSAIDTIAVIENENVISIPSRENLYYTQTPQAFKYHVIKKSHENAVLKNITNFSDDVSMVIKTGFKVKKVDGSYDNIKITTKTDYETAKVIARKFLQGQAF